MRVLMTGGTNRQVKPPERRGNSGSTAIDVPAYIVAALEAAGHTVEWRHVTPGEDLHAQFDVVWFCWAPWLSRTTPGTFSALYAWASGLPRVVFLDDWAYHQGFSHMRTIMNPEAKGEAAYLCRPDFFGGPDRWTEEQLREWFPLIEGVGHNILTPGEWTRTTVVTPQYGWGSPELLRRDPLWADYTGEFFKLDPSAHVAPAENLDAVPASDERERRWALASLSPQKEWVDKQMLRWPVAFFGCRSLNRKGVESPRLRTEADVFAAYRSSLGILAPPYSRLKGAGWFRSRWLYGALGGSYVLSAQDDMLPGVTWRPGREVEAAPEADLAAWTREQGDFVRANMWSAAKFDEQCDRLVRHVASK